MKKITLHAADGGQLAGIELKNRKRVILLPPPDVEPAIFINGITNYTRGDVVEIIPDADSVTLYIKNNIQHTKKRAGEFSTLNSLPRMLTFQDGKYLSLTVKDTDEELYTIAKAQAAAEHEKKDQYTAIAIFVSVVFIIFLAWYFNLAGFFCLLLCLVAL